MANSIKVFTSTEYSTAINIDATNVLLIEKKKDEKAYKGTRFLNAFFNIGASKRSNGWFHFENMLIPMGIADPADKTDIRNEFEGTRLQFASSVSKAGEFGAFIAKLQPEYRKQIDALTTAGIIKLDGQKIHDLITLLTGKNSKNPNQPIADPYLSIKIDFDPYPMTFKPTFLAGTPRTQILDWNTRTIDASGKESFLPAMVMSDDGVKELVTAKNLHKFVTPGSIIRSGRVNIPSVAISQAWISMPITANRVIIEPGGEAGFSDEVIDTGALKAALTGVAQVVVPDVAQVVAPAVAQVVVPAVAPIPASIASPATDDVMAALNSI